MPSSPLRIGPRIQETTTTTGPGPLALAGATDGHFPFSAVQPVPVAITVPYLNAWAGGMEWGYGEISSDGTTLARVIVAGSYPGVCAIPAPAARSICRLGQKRSRWWSWIRSPWFRASRTEQQWWQAFVEPFRDGRGDMLRKVRLTTHFLPGRTRFGHPGNPEGVGVGSPPFACVLLVWRCS